MLVNDNNKGFFKTMQKAMLKVPFCFLYYKR